MGVRAPQWGWEMAEMATNTVFSWYKENGQKKMEKNSLVDVIFIGSHAERTTMVVHDKKK